MRLIDADKLRHELIMGHDLIGAKYTDMADTVKAIPIEWMKNYARKICTDDDGRYNSKAYGIDRMIYDWEKENEHKESD